MKQKYTKNVKPIRTKKDHQDTIMGVDKFFDAKKRPIEAPNRFDAIQIRSSKSAMILKSVVLVFRLLVESLEHVEDQVMPTVISPYRMKQLVVLAPVLVNVPAHVEDRK